MIALGLAVACSEGPGSKHPDRGETNDGTADSGAVLPGTSATPTSSETYFSLLYSYDGGFIEFPGLGTGLDLFVNLWKYPAADGYSPVLDQGKPLDDCTVYGGYVDLAPGAGTADAGPFHVDAGDLSYDLGYGDDYVYGYPGYGPHLTSVQEQAPPPWGQLVSVSLAGSDEAPGFDLDPVARFPAGPLLLTAPEVDAVLAPDAATLRWNALDADPILLSVSVQWGALPDALNVICVAVDDGEFTIPPHVWDWVPKLSKPLIGVEARRGGVTRYVEISPHRWAAFNLFSRMGDRFWVQN